jgi:hypothetical protein
MCGAIAFLFITTTSAHTAAYFVPGLNIIPAFINSPQFLSLAISKSNLLLAFVCCIKAIFARAASLHNSCAFLSNGVDHVIEKPTPKL